MRNRFIPILFMILFISIIHPHSAKAADPLNFVTGDFPPYSYMKDGQLAGFSVEIVKALMKQAGCTAEITQLPWKRAHNYAESQPILLFPLTRLPYREKRFKWIGPIMVDSSVFVVRSSDQTIYEGVDDFLSLQVGVADSTPAMFRMRELGFKNLQPVKSELMNAKKLLVVHRIDAWHGPYLILMYTIINAGLDLSAIRVAYKEMDFEMYIGASLAVPDETVALWQKNLDEMKESGQYQTILYHAFLKESETKD